MDFLDVCDFDFDRFDEADANASSSESTGVYDSLSSVSFSESNSDTEDPVRRRKRKFRHGGTQRQLQQHQLSYPRVVQSDIRRNFPTLFARVYNACDYDTMMDHIRSYYTGNVSVQQRDLRFGELLCYPSIFSRLTSCQQPAHRCTFSTNEYGRT